MSGISGDVSGGGFGKFGLVSSAYLGGVIETVWYTSVRRDHGQC